jgi:tetratricopeptide (TPR) repeat protein
VPKNSVELVETTGRSLEELAATGRIASVFCRLARSRFTGVVYVEHDDGGGVFTFREGMPIYVEELGHDAALADQLFAQGLLNATQHAEVTAAALISGTENEDLAFCEQAVQLGVLTQEQVDAELERRLRGRLIQAVGIAECRIEIDADPEMITAVPEYPLDLGPLIHTGVRTFFDDEAVRRTVGATEELYVRLNVANADAVQFFDLDSDEEDLIAQLDPQTTVDRTIESAAADPLDAWQLISMLVIAELAEIGHVPFAPASERSGLRTNHAIGARPSSARGASSARIPVPREDDEPGANARVSREDVISNGSRARMPAVKPGSIAGMPAARPDTMPQGSRSAMPAVSPPGSQHRMPAAREDSSPKVTPPARPPSAPIQTAGNPGPQRTTQQAYQAAAAAAAAQQQQSAARHGTQPGRPAPPAQSGPVVARATTPGNEVSAADRKRPRRKLSAALQRLDRGLKELRAPGSPAAPAPTPAVAEPAAAAAPHAHVEQLLRMRAQNMAQKKTETETTNATTDLYRQGQKALRDNEFARAHDLLKRAFELSPNDEGYRLQMQWAALRAGVLDEEGLSKLRATLREQVSDEQHKKFAYYALGHLALFEKKDEAAEKFFRKAIELDRNNKDAERHLRIIELRRKSAAEAGGNKIFGIEIGSKKKE